MVFNHVRSACYSSEAENSDLHWLMVSVFLKHKLSKYVTTRFILSGVNTLFTVEKGHGAIFPD